MATKSKQVARKWTVDVDVCVYPVGNDPEFEIESYLQRSKGGDLVFHNRGRGGFQVKFHLKNAGGLSYVFPSDPSRAISSRRGSGECPGPGEHEIFEPESVENNGLTLVVSNPNPSPRQGNFSYSLWLTGASGDRCLDPGGINQNGNYRR